MPPRRTWSLSEPSCSIALLNRSVICPCSLMRSWSRVALTDSLVNTSAYTAANAEMEAIAVVTGGHHHGDAAHNIPLRIAARPAAITIDHTPVMCHVRFLSLGSRWREGASLIGTPDPTGPRHRTAPR